MSLSPGSTPPATKIRQGAPTVAASGGPENEFTQRNTTFMTWNLMHLAKMLKELTEMANSVKTLTDALERDPTVLARYNDPAPDFADAAASRRSVSISRLA